MSANVTGTFETVARELTRQGAEVVRKGRGAVAPVLDGAARQAEQRALALWTTYGTGESASKLGARMSSDRSKLQGYLIGSGLGGFFQEVGTGHHPPQPVLGPAIEQSQDKFAKALLDVAGKL
jgi:hypothetical protein